MSSSSESDSDEETVSSLEIGDFKDGSGRWSDEVSSSSEEASSSDEEDGSTDVTSEASSFNNRKGNAKLGSDTTTSSGSFVSESDESSEEDSEPKLKSAMKKPAAKPAMKKPATKSAMKKESIAPPGISKDAYKRFFSKPVELSPEKQSPRVVSNEPNVARSRLLIQHAEDERKQRRNELSSSQHSLKSCEDLIEKMNKDLLTTMDGIDETIVADISIQAAGKNYKKGDSRPRSEMDLLRDKRDMRLAKVRERIRAKEQAEERDVDSKKMQEFEDKLNGNSGFDMSENARRERAYGWYTRMAMPSKIEMKQRIVGMPTSSGVRVEDIDLLPWAASGRMVNVAKMHKFINDGFKKKLTPRQTKTKKPDSDSESS